ncbi:hypothetical protein, partial [Pedobacter sp. UBA5917]|uniref:hypothetical protein n=1 Tax=Pedobacter sp. UBA5917 TaxID=1947061 RepID=UPI0025CC16DA
WRGYSTYGMPPFHFQNPKNTSSLITWTFLCILHLWKINHRIIINLKTLMQTINFMPWKPI